MDITVATVSANPFLAQKIGLNEAMFINNFYLWCSPAKDNPNKRTYFDGRYWINVSLNELKYIFPFMSISSIRRCLDRLISLNLIVKDNFNLTVFEKKLWYALTDHGLAICQNEQSTMFKMAHNIIYTSFYNCIIDNKLYLKYYNKLKINNARAREEYTSGLENDNQVKLVKAKSFGRYNNIWLSQKEYENIQRFFPNPSADIPAYVALDAVSEYLHTYPEKVDEIQGKYYYYVTSFIYTKVEKNYKAKLRTKENNKSISKKPSSKYTKEQLDSFFTNLDEVDL